MNTENSNNKRCEECRWRYVRPPYQLCYTCHLANSIDEGIVVGAVLRYLRKPLFEIFSTQREKKIKIGSKHGWSDVVLLQNKKIVAIVECKRIGEERIEGIAQLKSYLSASSTKLGVFANDTDPAQWVFLRNRGESNFQEISRSAFESEILPQRIQIFLILNGDITQADVDAIVNPTDHIISGGGGLDREIQWAGGDVLIQACREIFLNQGRLAAGRAVLTLGGDLRAPYVIHTVGPDWRGGNSGESVQLANCYEHCLRLAAENSIRSIAFPSISTGFFNYPLEEAARVALTALKDFVAGAQYRSSEVPKRIHFFLPNKETCDYYTRILSEPAFEHYFTLSEG